MTNLECNILRRIIVLKIIMKSKEMIKFAVGVIIFSHCLDKVILLNNLPGDFVIRSLLGICITTHFYEYLSPWFPLGQCSFAGVVLKRGVS